MLLFLDPHQRSRDQYVHITAPWISFTVVLFQVYAGFGGSYSVACHNFHMTGVISARLELRTVTRSVDCRSSERISHVRLIPTCVLRDTSKMREVGHRTETFRIGFQLIESVTYLVNHLIERGKSEIRQVFFAQFFPYMFYGIQLWTVGRLSNQSHICRNLEIF